VKAPGGAEASDGRSARPINPLMREGLLQLRVDGLLAQIVLAIAIVGATTALGWALRLMAPGATPSALLFPAILFASLIGGWRSGATAGVLALFARNFSLRPPPLDVPDTTTVIDFALFAVAGAAVIAIGSYTRTLIARLRENRDALGEQSRHYSALFETMSEGYAVVEAMRDAKGRLSDYTITEINPALQRMLGVGPEAAGSRLTDAPGNWDRWLQVCDRVLATGDPVSFERFNRATKLWHEVHLSRLTGNSIAQFFFDITARKAGEARQAELFDELNHRVKNNLAMVASLLQLQARGADEAVRDHLGKAAARVQGIAEVHNALSRGASNEAVDFGAYLQDLVASLRRTLAVDERIGLGVETEAVDLPVDTAIPLGMVVNELVTNAVKYAYAPGTGGRIEVRFRRDGERLTLTVSDHGKGLPDGGEESGLGMRLVRSMVEQIGGALTISGGDGASFEVSFKAAD
jgi:two-component sensor histidine kinase